MKLPIRIGILIIAIAVVVAGCQERRVSPTASAPVTAPPPSAQLDPEVAELMALLDHSSTPSASKGEMPEAAVINIRQHSYQPVGRDTDPSVDASGERMVFATTAHSRHSDIYMKSVDGRAVTQLTTEPDNEIQPALSPDGSRLAFASDRGGHWNIYIMAVDGKSISKITRGGGENLHPSWSPDGTRLVYCCHSHRSGQWELWMVDLSQSSAREFLGYGLFPEWSPSEDVIAYQRPRGRGERLYGIWTTRLANGEPQSPTLVASSEELAYVCPTFSRDGRQLAFTAVTPSMKTASTDIYCVGVNGNNLQCLTRGPGRKYSPYWAGDRIYFSYDHEGAENIWSVQANATPRVAAAPQIQSTDMDVVAVQEPIVPQD